MADIINVDRKLIFASKVAAKYRRMRNGSGGAVVKGDVAIYKTSEAGGDVFTTTTAQDNPLVVGMVAQSIASNDYGLVQVEGWTDALKVNGTTDIAVGDYISTYTVAKIAGKATAGKGGIFAIALEAYATNDSAGVINAILGKVPPDATSATAPAIGLIGDMPAAGTGTANTIGTVTRYSPPDHVHALGTHVHSGATTGGAALTAPSITGGTAVALTSFGIRSTGTGAFDLTLANAENLVAGRTLTLKVNDAARTIDIAGNLTFAAAFTTSGANAITLTTTGATSITLPTTGTLATIAGTETFTNKTLTAPTITGGTHTAITSFGIRSTGAAYDLVLATAVVFTASRTLTVTIPDAATALTLTGDLIRSGAHSLTLTTSAATNVTLPTTGTLATLAGTETFTDKTLTTPTIGDLTNATHTHANAAGGGTLTWANALAVADAGTHAHTSNTTGGSIQARAYFSSFSSGAQTAAADKWYWLCPIAGTITDVRAYILTAPTGASFVIDVHKNGTTVFTTQGNRPTIAIDGFASTTTAPDVTAISAGDRLSYDVDQVGSTIAGSSLMVVVTVKAALV